MSRWLRVMMMAAMAQRKTNKSCRDDGLSGLEEGRWGAPGIRG